MKHPLQKMSMHKRMMLYFAVPLILMQILLCSLCYPQVVRRYREKTDYSMEQSVSQAISFTESYLRNMTYLANMVEDNGVIQNTLSADGFGEERPYMEQWLEYYELNKEFNSYEISNSIYRFCLYVPDEVMYAGNQYYFDGVSRLKERSDYVDLRYALNTGEDYVAISRERDGVDQQDTSQMVTLYHRIASKKEKEEELGICSISVSAKYFQDIMKNANITSEGLVYLMSENGRMITSSNSSILQKMQKKGILLNYGAELFMEKKKEGQKEYYITRQNVDGASWQMILIIPESEYEDQYRFLWLSAALMLGSMIAVIVLMSYLLSGYYVGRLKKLNAEMTGLESGNLNANLPITTEEDEIEEIYHNFNGMVQEVQRLMQEHYQLGKEVKMAEVRALQAQINPHFLYNTLDLINWISMDYGAEEIGTLTWNLARFYRLSLNHGKSLISIGEEVEHVEVYVNIENYHFDNAISLEVDVPEELKSYACLNIILQPFVENAIVHGIAEKPDIESCEIRIRARREEQDIIFSVQDDGPGVDVEQMQKETQQDIRTAQHGYGVRNINFRLKLCFGEKYGVTYLESEKGTHVEIKIPVMTIAEAEEKI
ncbi:MULTISPECIES: sensor histidine kinase [Lachnospiraceae]|jgi:two-component system sensor histidine kinase YesM|uniref:sensor histidine kinase n=1 Tax=Lachnospiraceae TaxID=186803 RepID=UPI000E5DA2C3|nr:MULTISPECIES: sensor histidine kinase [Lachnospiraceae]RHV97223.1 sensor histidine kinase [Blautia sp. OF09-25XD]